MDPSQRPSSAPLGSIIGPAWKKNGIHTAIFEFLWGAGMPFTFPFAVLPLYLVALGRSRTFLQSVLVVIALLGLLQIWSGRWSHGVHRHRRISFLWMLNGSVWLLYGSLALLLRDQLGPVLLSLLLAGGLMAGSLFFYLANPAYYEMLVENIPLHRRGAIAGLRILANGAGALLGIPFAAALMRSAPIPDSFHWRFVVGGLLMSAGTLWFWTFFRDVAAVSPHNDPPPAPLATVSRLLRCPPFRRFLIGHMLLAGAQSLAPLLVAAAKDRLRPAADAMEPFVLSFFLGIALVGPLIAWLGDRMGFRRVAALNGMLLALAFAAAAWTSAIPHGRGRSLFVAYGLYGASVLVATVVLSHFGSELIPEIKPSFFFATAVVLAGPCTLVAAPLGGAVVDGGGRYAYAIVFAAAALLAAASALVFSRFVPEPRRPDPSA